MAVSAEVLATTRFDSAQSLADTLSRYVRLYNHQIPQRALGHLSPVQALQDWQEKCPRLFKKKVYNLTGLDRVQNPVNIGIKRSILALSLSNPLI